MTSESTPTARSHTESKDMGPEDLELQRVIYAVSHDLQAPTRHISSFMELLLASLGELGADSQRYVDFINGATVVLRERLSALTRYSRVVSRGTELRPCDTDQALELALSQLETDITAAGATINRQPLAVVYADHDQLVEVFVELLSNAIKFGCDRPVIEIEGETDDTTCLISVRDNGHGFRDRDLDDAFDLFRRFHDASVPGTGSGLAIVRRIIELHHGTISLKSSEEGAWVQFRLNLDQPAEKTIAPNEQ